MSRIEQQYLDTCKELVDRYHREGSTIDTVNRTATNATKGWVTTLRHDFSEGFPLLTTKRVFWHGVVTELVGFLAAVTNNNDFNAIGRSVWDEWALQSSYESVRTTNPTDRLVHLANSLNINVHEADKLVQESIKTNGYQIGLRKVYEDNNIPYDIVDVVHEAGALGPIYGAQWRNFDGTQTDQIADVLAQLKLNPQSRRLLVSAWNPKVLPEEGGAHDQNVIEHKQVLPPCHYAFQFDVTTNPATGSPVLNSMFNMRSADMFLGVPFNIASYALMTAIFAHECNYELGESVGVLNNYHIYHNHIEQLELQASREMRTLPQLVIPPEFDLWAILSSKGRKTPEVLARLKTQVDILTNAIVGYEPHAGIKGSVAI